MGGGVKIINIINRDIQSSSNLNVHLSNTQKEAKDKIRSLESGLRAIVGRKQHPPVTADMALQKVLAIDPFEGGATMQL